MEKINGLVLAKMIDLGSKNLAKNAEKINSLNVFPVPDGDTGTNMNLSMSSGAKETAANVVENIGELGKSFSKGLLMGARGNSGVILSQLFRGMSQHIAGKSEIDAKEFAAAIQNGVSIAYKAIIKPVEGTILTVAREAAEAGVKAAENTTSVIEVMDAIYLEAQESLKRTPELLPILKEVGVVDSGGQGLVCVYQGFVAALKGEEIEGLDTVETNVVDMQFEDDHDMDFMSPEDIVYGFCTEFTVRLDKDKKEFNEDKFREDMSKFGDSLLVISDSEYVKIHVHTETPGEVFNYGQQYGELIKIKSDNMREQHREVLRKQEAKQASAPKEVKEQAMISISMGAGLSKVLKSMGVDYIVEGGQTMNPSTEDIMKAIKEVNAKNIYIFPNNKNIQLAAKQAAELAEENVFVIESKTAPQGLAAVMVFNSQLSPEENFANMQEVLSTVSTLEVTHAVRDTNIEGVEIKKDQFMGIKDGKIVVSDLSLNTVLEELLEAKQASAPKEVKEQAMISISMGAGLSKVLKSMGVDYIVEGGQTMNPSTEDIMKAIKEVNAKNIYIFPNNKNIQLAAKQAAELAEENVFVIESKTAPQGLAAVMVFNSQLSPEENFANMQEVLSTVSTLEVTHAVRDTNIEGVEIKKDQFMGIKDGKIVVSDLSLNTVLEELLEKSLDEDKEIVTLYLGEDSTDEYTDFLEELLENKYPDVEVELIESGQPVYPYIIGVE